MLKFFRRIRRAVVGFLADHAPETVIGVFIIAFVLVVFRHEMFISIGPGHYGVLWRRFGGGTDMSQLYGEGLHLIYPFDKMYIFNGQVQMEEEDLDVLSSDGLKMEVNVVYRFSLNPDHIGALAKYVGPDYKKKLVAPQVASLARNIFSNNTPEEIFSARRQDIEDSLTNDVQELLDSMFQPAWHKGPPLSFVKVWDVLIRGITLPPVIAAAVERKNEAKQNNEAYDYRLLSEAKEAQRKLIEADGIEKFQQKVSPSLTDSYLQWQGIQATRALAESHNSKIVVIGGGKSGMPVILGGLDDNRTLATAKTEETAGKQADKPQADKGQSDGKAAPDKPASDSQARPSTDSTDGAVKSTPDADGKAKP